MAKTDNKKNKKVPGALIIAVVVIIAIAVFVPSVYMPYKNKKPQMDADHQEALSSIAYLDDSIAGQAAIEADIKDLTAQWEQYRKDMFVEPETALDDINSAVLERGIEVKKFNRGKPMQDPSDTVTSEGNPLYYVTIDLSCVAEREALIDFLKYVEQESVGCYYVKKLDQKPIPVESDSDKATDTEKSNDDKSSDADKKSTDTSKDKEKQASDTDTERPTTREHQEVSAYDVNMQIYLYYFNQDVVLVPEVEETDSAATE